ncbi:MAG: MerR family transcriptional regulator [Desulfobulbaceae bacterium]|nr:MerR family transcriptional regulator [Desulfobulbaceae bacterium]
MVRKKQIEPLKKDLSIYPIGVAAKLLGVHPRTLRIYEDEGLIKPERAGNRRLYSTNDITWVGCLRKLIHDDGISIPGIRKLLRYATCYEISDCPRDVHCNCDAVVDRAIPRSLRVAGDLAEEKKAKERDVAAKKEHQDIDERENGSNRKVR